uniref:TIL domain-containing protein n=1 Tax=Acrobeloides nanus TaxID=290746 RepID=A0A914DQS0_9BILA
MMNFVSINILIYLTCLFFTPVLCKIKRQIYPYNPYGSQYGQYGQYGQLYPGQYGLSGTGYAGTYNPYMYGSGGVYGGTGMNCRTNEVWNQCGLMCVQTCQNQAPVCPSLCASNMAGCTCALGNVRDLATGMCMPASTACGIGFGKK